MTSELYKVFYCHETKCGSLSTKRRRKNQQVYANLTMFMIEKSPGSGIAMYIAGRFGF